MQQRVERGMGGFVPRSCSSQVQNFLYGFYSICLGLPVRLFPTHFVILSISSMPLDCFPSSFMTSSAYAYQRTLSSSWPVLALNTLPHLLGTSWPCLTCLSHPFL